MGDDDLVEEVEILAVGEVPGSLAIGNAVEQVFRGRVNGLVIYYPSLSSPSWNGVSNDKCVVGSPYQTCSNIRYHTRTLFGGDLGRTEPMDLAECL